MFVLTWVTSPQVPLSSMVFAHRFFTCVATTKETGKVDILQKALDKGEAMRKS